MKHRIQILFKNIFRIVTNRIIFLWVLSIILFAPEILYASGYLSGQVIDKTSNNPLVGANVQILGTIMGASTDRTGRFYISKLPAGIYTIRVSMIGYHTETEDSIAIIHGQRTNPLLIKLKETAIQFDPVIVSAGKIKQRLDQAPISLSVLTAKEIENRQPANLIESLETMAGVHFIGNQINIRGSTGYTFGAGNKVLLLLDGVPVYASDTGQFNWDMLPPLDIEQIEVLKGAGSTLWGASALGGVVNIITKSPAPEGKFLMSCKFGKYDEPYYEEWYWTDQNRLHYTRQDLSYSKQFSGIGVRISAGRYKSTGYTELGNFTKYNLTGKFDFPLHGDIKLTLYSAYSHIHRGIFVQWRGQNDPYQVDESNLGNYARVNQLNLYSKLAIPVSPNLGIYLRASVIRTLMGEQFGSGADFNPAYGQGLELQSDWIPCRNHLITFGIQYQHDAGSAEYFGDHKGYFIGTYVQNEWTLKDNLRITTGFRYDRYQLIGGVKEDLFSPRLGLNWQPVPATSIRASVGSGFRAATIIERFLEISVMNFNIKANPALKAESSWAYDIGFRHYFLENWNIDVSLFDTEYWELIEAHLDLIRGQIQFRNIPRARIQGIEATTKISSPVRFPGFRLNVDLQFSITLMNHEELKWNEPLTYRPRSLSTLKSTFSVGPVRLQIDYRYAMKIQEVKIYPINDRVPMKILDIRMIQKINKVRLQFGIDNVLQYNYAPMESNLLPMRTFSLGILCEL